MRRDPDSEWTALKAGVEAVLAEYQQRGGRLADAERKQLAQALAERDPTALREALAQHALLAVWINPEARVKVARGKAEAILPAGQAGMFLVEVLNDAGIKSELRVRVQPGPDRQELFTAELIRTRQAGDRLSGLVVQYLLISVRCREAGRREALFVLDAGQGTQDLGFRSEVPVLFRITPQESKP
jgi:hypothetical protein